MVQVDGGDREGRVPAAATWGLLAVFAVHDLEELATMAPWAERLREQLHEDHPWIPERATALLEYDQEHVNTSIGLMALIVAAAAADGARTNGRSAFYQTVLAGFGLHAVTHVAQAAALRGYTPGSVTAPLVVAPFSVWAWRTLRRHGVLRPTSAGDAALTAALVPGAIIGVQAGARGLRRLKGRLRQRRRLAAAMAELEAGRGIERDLLEVSTDVSMRHRRSEALEYYARLSTEWDYEGWRRRHEAEEDAEN